MGRSVGGSMRWGVRGGVRWGGGDDNARRGGSDANVVVALFARAGVALGALNYGAVGAAGVAVVGAVVTRVFGRHVGGSMGGRVGRGVGGSMGGRVGRRVGGRESDLALVLQLSSMGSVRDGLSPAVRALASVLVGTVKSKAGGRGGIVRPAVVGRRPIWEYVAVVGSGHGGGSMGGSTG